MNKNSTNEFSFILKPSKFGIGVFATHDIAKDTFLRLFGGEGEAEHNVRILSKKDVPELFQEYPLHRGDKLVCPNDFGAMPVGWYLNHSKTPNATHKDYKWYASLDIKAGEEIFIDYNSLGEPAEDKETYYSN